MVKLSYYERRKNAPDGKEFMAERSRREIVKAKETKLKGKNRHLLNYPRVMHKDRRNGECEIRAKKNISRTKRHERLEESCARMKLQWSELKYLLD